MDGWAMITAGQLRAARALLGIDQRQLAALAGLSVPTIQRMEASDGVIRGNVDSLMKLIAALDAAGIELIGEGGSSPARRTRRPAEDASRGRRRGAGRPGPPGDRVRAGARWRWSCCCGVSRACSRWRWRASRSDGAPVPATSSTARASPCAWWPSAPLSGSFSPAAPRPWPCRSGCPGSARICGSTRWPRSSRSSSISAVPRPASSAWATAATSRRRTGSCRSSPPFSPA